VATVDLVVAFALVGVGWAAIAAALYVSLRHADVAETVDGMLAAKTAPWRPGPANRPADKFDLVGAGGRG
jgi:hypothetical protein